jgi:hypothetical protein|tara:strand:- start:441 stop:638 length:198 start_codon:yes stop_codon:yes gene_type:complete
MSNKRKKLTYNELANYIVTMENRFTHALNVVGQTLTDYIEYNKDDEKFKKFLKKKYNAKEEKKED